MPRMVTTIPKNTPLVKEHLAGLSCPCGRDHDFIFSPLCHLDAPVMASYNKHTGILLVECSICGDTVVRIAVASREDASQIAAMPAEQVN